MSDALYGKALLRLAADAHGAGRLSQPHATGEAHNPACGDRVIVDLVLAEGRIAAIAHETKACVLTQASASILGQYLKNASRQDVETLRQAVAGMLAKGGTAPDAPFDTYAALREAATYPGRHRCVLLPLEAVLAALDASGTQEAEPVGS